MSGRTVFILDRIPGLQDKLNHREHEDHRAGNEKFKMKNQGGGEQGHGWGCGCIDA